MLAKALQGKQPGLRLAPTRINSLKPALGSCEQ